MNYILTSEDYLTTEWSGGKTTELFIFPPEASFKSQNYDIRLSTASVENNESTFTPLPNVDRTLMVLDGELALHHKGHHKSRLKKFDIDCFKGDWLTSSKGTCVDFNLMLKNNLEGDLNYVKFDGGEHKIYGLNDADTFSFVYLLNGALSVQTEKGVFILEKENLLILEHMRRVRFSSINPSEFLIIKVKKIEDE